MKPWVSENVFILSSHLSYSVGGCKIVSYSFWIWRHLIVPCVPASNVSVENTEVWLVCTSSILSHSESSGNFLIVLVSLKLNDVPLCVGHLVGSFQHENLCLLLLKTFTDDFTFYLFLSFLFLNLLGCFANFVIFSYILFVAFLYFLRITS